MSHEDLPTHYLNVASSVISILYYVLNDQISAGISLFLFPQAIHSIYNNNKKRKL